MKRAAQFVQANGNSVECAMDTSVDELKYKITDADGNILVDHTTTITDALRSFMMLEAARGAGERWEHADFIDVQP